MRRFKPFSIEGLESFQASFASMKGGRLRVTSHLPMDLHEKKTQKLRDCRDAGVLVTLCNVKGEPSLLYTVRSAKLRSHAGHVSFPGGGRDEGESAVDTALRETHEEIGIAGESVHVLGLGQTVFSITGVLVTPVIGFIKEDVGEIDFEAQKSVDEVDTVFTVPLTRFTNDPEFTSSEVLTRNSQSASFPCYGLNEDKTRSKFTIWGLTATMTEGLLKEMLGHLQQSES